MSARTALSARHPERMRGVSVCSVHTNVPAPRQDGILRCAQDDSLTGASS